MKYAIETKLLPSFDAEAHRGGRGLWPENTIPAMLNALDLPITTLELDCHISRDHQVIVTHDEQIDPAFITGENGAPIDAGRAAELIFYQMDYEQIRKYDAGIQPNPEFPQQQSISTHIPLLSDLIDQVQLKVKNSGRKQPFYNIETKLSPEGDGVLHPSPEIFADLLMKVLREKEILPWVIIQSFDPRTLEIIHEQYPSVKLSFLTSSGSLKENLEKLSFKPDIFSPDYNLVDAGLLRGCHEQHIKVIPWTVNEKDEIDRLRALGVDGIITDYPDLF